MNVALFGGFGKRMCAPGWTKETAVAVFGGGEFDLTEVPPGDNATLTAVALFGGIEIHVDEGSRITMSGFSLFGGREVKVTAGGGPTLHIRAFALFGGIEVNTKGSVDAAKRAGGSLPAPVAT